MIEFMYKGYRCTMDFEDENIDTKIHYGLIEDTYFEIYAKGKTVEELIVFFNRMAYNFEEMKGAQND